MVHEVREQRVGDQARSGHATVDDPRMRGIPAQHFQCLAVLVSLHGQEGRLIRDPPHVVPVCQHGVYQNGNQECTWRHCLGCWTPQKIKLGEVCRPSLIDTLKKYQWVDVSARQNDQNIILAF